MVIAEDSVHGSRRGLATATHSDFSPNLDTDGVRRRSGKDRVTTAVGWKRRIGGQFGVELSCLRVLL